MITGDSSLATTKRIGLPGDAPACANDAKALTRTAAKERAIPRRTMTRAACPNSSVVTHRLDVVPVRIEHESAVVVRVIVLPESGRAVIATAGRERGLVEGIDLCARLGAKRHVDRRNGRRALADPEVGLPRDAQARSLIKL